MKLMECTRDISPVIRHRMGACGCRSNWRLHSSVRSMSERRSQFSEERLEQTNTPQMVCHRIEGCSHGLADQWIPGFNHNTIHVIWIPGGADFASGRWSEAKQIAHEASSEEHPPISVPDASILSWSETRSSSRTAGPASAAKAAQ